MTEEIRLIIGSLAVFSLLSVSSWKFYKPLSMMFGGWAVLIAAAAVGALCVETSCLFSGVLLFGAFGIFAIQTGFVMPGFGKHTRARYVFVYADWDHNKLYNSSHHEFTNGIRHNGREVVQDETMNGREIGRAFELVHPHVWKYGEGADLEFYEARVDFRRKTLTVEYLDNAEKRRQLAAADRGQFSSEAFCIAFNPPPIVTKTFKLTDADLKGLK